MAEDSQNQLFSIVWDPPLALPRTWATTDTLYIIRLWNYQGGSPILYEVHHPTVRIYSWAPYSSKLHVEIFALQELIGQFTKIVSKDLHVNAKPEGTTQNFNLPSFDTILGNMYFGTYVPCLVDFPTVEGWLRAETVLTGLFLSPARTEGATYHTNGSDSVPFYADLPVGILIHQRTTIIYPDDVEVVYETDFLVPSS